jgi:hypothetical protein
MFLTYTFVSTPIVSRGRSTPHFPPRQLSPAGRIVARHPFPVPLPALPTAYLPLTPLRGFSSPRDQSAGPIRRREAYPDDSPDCLSLPACCMIEPAARGSTFQTRYVSPDLLFREPLGTMVPSDPGDNSFSSRHARPEHGIRWLGTFVLLLDPSVFPRLSFVARGLVRTSYR